MAAVSGPANAYKKAASSVFLYRFNQVISPVKSPLLTYPNSKNHCSPFSLTVDV
jgi:hypothetical protein